MRRWLIYFSSAVAAALLSALFAAAPALTQAKERPDCFDDKMVDRCEVRQQERVRRVFGVKSIEEHRDAGDQVRRVFYVDGYGHDVVAVAFVRSPARDPEVWVHYPQQQGEPRPEPLRAPVPRPVWSDLIERGQHFDRDVLSRSAPAAEPRAVRAPADAAEEPETIQMCMHSWVFTIEAVDRGRSGQTEIRRKTEDACENGHGELYAQQVQRIALSLIPHCAALDVAQYRNEAVALQVCGRLRGDRIAAAEVRNRADPFFYVGGPDEAVLIAPLFHGDATVTWDREEHRGPLARAHEFWAARLRGPAGETGFFFESIEGLYADRVRLRGSLSRPVRVEGEQVDWEAAAVEQIWTRVNGGDWRIEEATVGAWQPERQ